MEVDEGEKKVLQNNNKDDDTACPVCYESFSDIEAPIGLALLDDDDDESSSAAAVDGGAVELHDGCLVVCRNCLHQFVTLHISQNVVPIPCMSQDCKAVLSRSLVQGTLEQHQQQQQSVDDEVPLILMHQYNRLERLAENPSLVTCPRCQELVDPQKDVASSTTTRVINNGLLNCPTCHHTFCRHHGDVHAGMTCRQYRRTLDGKLSRQTEQMLQAYTKPCSHCGVRLQKSRGCNLVTCGSCRRVMCYKCGTHQHLAGKRVFRCTHCETVVEGHFYCGPWVNCVLASLGLVFYLTFATVWAVLVALVGTLSGCFCGCFCCGKGVKNYYIRNGDADAGRFAPWRGFLAVCTVIFVFFLRIVEVCGPDFVDALLPSSFDFLRELSPEIPVMDTTDRSDDADDDDDDVDDNLALSV